MKKRLLNFTPFLTVAAIAAFSLSSCLGDSESTQEFQDDFVYINQESGGVNSTLYAINAYGQAPFTFNGIGTEYRAGDCLKVSYKVSSNNMSGNIFIAENLDVRKVYRKANFSQISVQYGNVEASNNDPLLYPKDPKIGGVFKRDAGTYDLFTDNRWRFAFESSNDNNDQIARFKAEFYYNPSPEAQKEPDPINASSMIPVGENRIIIDVRFYDMSSQPTGIGTTKDFACDFSEIKRYYTPNYTLPDASTTQDNKKVVPVYFKFRFSAIDRDNKIVTRYLGDTWNAFPLLFVEK